MRKVAFIDGDGTLIDSDSRIDSAERRTEYILASVKPYLLAKDYDDIYKKIFYHPEMLYEPCNIAYDQIMAGARAKLAAMDERDWTIIILTAMPEYRRDDRLKTLNEWNVPFHYLVCKDTQAYQYAKTVEWKRAEVTTLSRILVADKVIVVDNEQGVLSTISHDPTLKKEFQVKTALSLDELKDTDID